MGSSGPSVLEVDSSGASMRRGGGKEGASANDDAAGMADDDVEKSSMMPGGDAGSDRGSEGSLIEGPRDSSDSNQPGAGGADIGDDGMWGTGSAEVAPAKPG